MCEIKTLSDYRAVIRRGPFAWPGGYPLYFIMADGGTLSFAAEKKNRREIIASFRDRDPQWRPVAIEINWEDPALFCDQTNERIPSAYAEPD